MPVLCRRLGRVRGLAALEVAAGLSITASLLVIATPLFAARFRASRFAEAVEGLERLGVACVAHGEGRTGAAALPPPAALTPAAPPRGAPAADPEELWAAEPWAALGFRPAPEGVPHAYAFAVDVTTHGEGGRFVARAHGDLDGDGVLSTFELRGGAPPGTSLALDPGLYVEAEVE